MKDQRATYTEELQKKKERHNRSWLIFLLITAGTMLYFALRGYLQGNTSGILIPLAVATLAIIGFVIVFVRLHRIREKFREED